MRNGPGGTSAVGEKYDSFFEEFEEAVGEVVELNNVLNDALLDLHVACTAAASPDPSHSLLLEVWTDGVRSTPQLLVDVAYADGSGRPSPWEIRHLLLSRPAVAEADRELSEALQDLTSMVRTHAAAGLLVRLSCQNADRRLPRLAAAAAPGAGHAHHMQAARVNQALAALRKVAPGLRVRVDVVPSPAPGARTFAWRLVTRELEKPQDGVPLLTGRRAAATPLQVAAAHGAAAISDAASTVAQQAAALAAATAAVPTIELRTRAQRRVVTVTPRSDAAAAAAAADAAMPPTPHSPHGNLAALASGFVSVARSVGSITYAAAHAMIPAMSHRFSEAGPVARSSLGGAPPSPGGAGASIFAGTGGFAAAAASRGGSSGGGAAAVAGAGAGAGAGGGGGPAAGGSPSAHGVSAAVQSEESAAALRRAVAGANHALFRLAKCAAAGGGGAGGSSGASSSGVDAAATAAAAAPRRAEPLSAAAVRGAKLVLEATVRAARQAASDAAGGSEAAAASAAAAAAAAAAKPPPSRASSGRSFSSAFGSKKVRDTQPTTARPAPPPLLSAVAAATPVCELVDVDARVVVLSEAGSAAGSQWPLAGGGRTANGAGAGGSLSGIAGAAGGGPEGLGSGRDWSWEWGIMPRVEGVTFPDCLPTHQRAVHDALEAAVAAGRAAWSGLPALSSEVSGLVSEAEMLFSENDHQVKKAAGDMMAAGRVRAALDRNANTIIACPALLGQLQAAVLRLVAALQRGGHSMRLMAEGLEPLDPRDAAATSASGVDVAPLTPLARGSAFTGPGSPMVGTTNHGGGSPLAGTGGGGGGLKKSMGGGRDGGGAAAAVVGRGRFAAAGIGSAATGSPRSGARSAVGEDLQAAATAAATANAAAAVARTAAAIAAAVADGEADAEAAAAAAAAAGLPLNGVAARSASVSTNGASEDERNRPHAETMSAPAGAASTVGVLPALSPARKRSGASVTVVLPGGGGGGPGHSPGKGLLAGRGASPALSPLGPLGGAAGVRDGGAVAGGASPLGGGLSRKKLPPLPPGRVMSGDGEDESPLGIAAASDGAGAAACEEARGVGAAGKRSSDGVAASSRRGGSGTVAAPVPAAAGISDNGGVVGM
ncbi:hypothetical protein HXX76_007052 [Chlamydomonas incerta]|uniref:Uncharacterized protein n=1 Tax=Chlamydomonas incerta TaxID=51695 RepID=A0A835T2K0_CHLIN|nr:hypothetical protein HXX76_007052 [Chlamydomonas incerta]|eukprot:KAG2435857.1 hypothetical protein HXX76_007052 [Chlamydomonas incerta]